MKTEQDASQRTECAHVCMTRYGRCYMIICYLERYVFLYPSPRNAAMKLEDLKGLCSAVLKLHTQLLIASFTNRCLI